MRNFHVNTGKFYVNTGKSPIFTKRKSMRVQSIIFRITVKTEDFPVFTEIRKFCKIDARMDSSTPEWISVRQNGFQ